MNLDKSIDKLSERPSSLYPDLDLDNDNEGITHWKGKPIISAEDWIRIAITGVKGSVLKEPFLGFAPTGLQYFPDDLVELALGFEGCLVDSFAEDIYPYHEGDPRLGTDEWNKALGPERKLSDAELQLWQTRIEEAHEKAKKENPLGIWIEEYKELLAFKKIPLPVYDDERIF